MKMPLKQPNRAAAYTAAAERSVPSINCANAPLPAPAAAVSCASRNYGAYLAVLLSAIALVIFVVSQTGCNSGKDFADKPDESQAAVSAPADPVELRRAYADKNVGERFEFGRYPQGANREVKPITWRVLRRDADCLLVISERCLDSRKYNEKLCDITWSDCSLRRWLNGEFYNVAFNGSERGLIRLSANKNNAGPSTEDRVFLLSIDEAEELFSVDADRRAKPTVFARNNGAYSDERNDNCFWWLRSRGSIVVDAAYVGIDGGVSVSGHGVNYDDSAVRPVLKLAL